jgi:hypothetical protein
MGARAGDREVVISNSVVSKGDESVTIDVFDIRVRLEFTNVPEAPPQTSFAAKEKTFTFALSNWNNPIGTAIQVQIGEYQNKPLVAAIYVHTIGETTDNRYRLVNYTFSIGGN